MTDYPNCSVVSFLLGIENQKVDPSPILDSTPNSPPIKSIKPLQIESPKPAPPFVLFK